MKRRGIKWEKIYVTHISDKIFACIYKFFLQNMRLTYFKISEKSIVRKQTVELNMVKNFEETIQVVDGK